MTVGFGYVAGIVAGSFLVHHLWMPIKVMAARKKYKVSYPDMYATKENCPDEDDKKTFNCVQRGHQNCLENQPIFLAALLCAGRQHPVISSALGSIYLCGKVLYFQGYATGNPAKRLQGSVSYIGMLGLVGVCTKMALSSTMSLLPSRA